MAIAKLMFGNIIAHLQCHVHQCCGVIRAAPRNTGSYHITVTNCANLFYTVFVQQRVEVREYFI